MSQLTRSFAISTILVAACGGDESSGSPAGGSGGGLGDAAEETTTDSGSDGPEQVDAGPYSLTVTNGYGSGSYAAGTTVHVWAALRPWDQLLTSWSGEASLLASPVEWHTQLVMPAHDVALDAIVESRNVQFEETSHDGVTGVGKTVLSYVPPSPKGLILFLHGTGGSASMIESAEAKYVALVAVERGYAVLSTEAEEVAAGEPPGGDGKIRWDPSLSESNLDFGNLDSLIAGIRQSGAIGASEPLYALGMSNGGAMALSLGAVAGSSVADSFPNLRFAAVVSHCAGGRASAAEVTTTPTSWWLCENDDNDQVSNEEAVANSGILASRGIPTEVDAHAASPLYDERFTRVEGVDDATSKAVAQELRAAGFVGADSMFVTASDDISAAVQADPAAFPATTALTGAQRVAMLNQLRVMQAEHEMYSDWAHRSIDFFEEYGGN